MALVPNLPDPYEGKIFFPHLDEDHDTYTQHIIDEVLAWITLKDKGKTSGMNYLLKWLHWWYDFT